jgi:hypothetical protein
MLVGGNRSAEHHFFGCGVLPHAGDFNMKTAD